MLAEEVAPTLDLPKQLSTEMLPAEYQVMYNLEDHLWWYIAMRRNLALFLERYWDWQGYPQPRVLDAGCGTGANLQHLLAGFEGQLPPQQAWGFDVSRAAVEFCRRRGLANRVVQGSITNIPFANQSFDIVVSCDVLNNLPDDRAGFQEISRVLRHNGLLLLNLPAYQFLYSAHDQAIGGRRRYNPSLVAQRLAEAGMKLERSTFLNAFLFPAAALVRFWRKRQVVTSRSSHSDLTLPPALLNRTLTGIMALETGLLRRTPLNFTFGLSLLTVARKL